MIDFERGYVNYELDNITLCITEGVIFYFQLKSSTWRRRLLTLEGAKFTLTSSNFVTTISTFYDLTMKQIRGVYVE